MTIDEEYFDWICGIVNKNRFSPTTSYEKLLKCLHCIEFDYSILDDINRMKDGIDLRKRFSYLTNKKYFNDSPCSVLEMMVALSIRCEENIMDDPEYGDRTSEWFWRMINNLGLSNMIDNRFELQSVIEIVDRFIKREYKPNGEGGLFKIKNSQYDLRYVSIWTQLGWYLTQFV